MPQDDIPLHRIEGQQQPGVFQRRTGMGKTVPTVAAVSFVPVIKKKVMQHRAPDQAAGIAGAAEPTAHPVAEPGDRHAVPKAGGIPVLEERLHPVERDLFQQFPDTVREKAVLFVGERWYPRRLSAGFPAFTGHHRRVPVFS